jgi:glutathione S-transferase
MYKLCNVKRWGSMAPHFVLEELGVPYQNIWMTPDQVRSEEFKRLSPLGFVPALGLDDGRVIIESMAIVAFLTEANSDKGMSPRPGSDDAAVYLSSLAFMSSNIYAIMNFADFSEDYTSDPAAQQRIRDKAIGSYQRVFDILDARLAKEGPFLLGETFSAADLYLFMLTIWAKPSERALLERCQAIARLCDHIRRRPKLKAALETHGVMKAAEASA